MVAVHGWSSRRRSSCSPEPSAVNDSWGHLFLPRAPGACTRQSPRIVFLYRPEIKRGRGGHRWRIVQNDSRFVGRIGMPAHDDQQGKKAEYVSETHVPAMEEPAPHRPRFRIHVGEGHARARAEPDHRSAEAHGVGEVAPVVAALLERQSREWDVVEY